MSLFIDAFEAALAQHGYHPRPLIQDGRIHRFAPPGRRDDSGWYVLFDFGGAFGDWAAGQKVTVVAEGRERDREIIERQVRQQQQELRRQIEAEQETAARQAANILSACAPAGPSPYLERKRVKAYGIGFDGGGAIIVPARDADGKLWTLQTIRGDGRKTFLKGGRARACFHSIGDWRGAEHLYIAEGYATAATVHAATGQPVIAAFNAGNIKPVLAGIRQHYKGPVTIAADNDLYNRPEVGNVGLRAAEEAARLYEARVVAPTFADVSGKPTDFNDLMILEGLPAVKGQLEGADVPPPEKPAEPEQKPQKKGIDRDAVEQLNADYALVLTGGQTRVLMETRDQDGKAVVKIISTKAFRDWVGPQAKYWLDSPGKRQYEGVVFDPKTASPHYYNLWKGFSIKPKLGGSCGIFKDHLRNILCRGNEGLYKWVYGWFAQMMQHPGDKPGTALAIRGRQGTGKTTIGEVMGQLLGDHYRLVSSPHLVTGQFNTHLANCLLLHADEGFWAGDKKAEGYLKSLITSDVQMIEAKGVDPYPVKNMTRIFVCSNSDWIVPAGFEERRFCVLDIGDEVMQDAGYFRAMRDELENGGYEALLHDLLQFDLSQINLREIPKTQALLEQKLESMPIEAAWWLDRLTEGSVTSEEEGWSSRMSTAKVYDDYIKFCQKQNRRNVKSPTSFGIALRKYCPGLYNTRASAGERVRVYSFPDLEACRLNFEELIGHKMGWENEQYQ